MKINKKLLKKYIKLALAGSLISTLISCVTNNGIHSGRMPFKWMESPLSERAAKKKQAGAVEKMERVVSYSASSDKHEFSLKLNQLREGDVIAFYMNRKQAWGHLRKGKIQKVPYEFFRYGHLAMVVTVETDEGEETKLLQLAMNQKVNTESGLSYLKDKNWEVYRPAVLNQSKLREFVRVAQIRGSSEKKAYDYSGAFGLINVRHKPSMQEEIAEEYTCCTLIIAALHYSGYKLYSTKRCGVLDIVTPRQVVDSWGAVVR